MASQVLVYVARLFACTMVGRQSATIAASFGGVLLC